MNQHLIRPVRAEEWQKIKELRIAALRDPVAHLAFLERLEDAEGRSDEFWQKRAAGAAGGRRARQFVAEAADGSWDGSVVVLVEEPGAADFFEGVIDRHQGHLVGVFVRAEQRGTGLIDELFRAAVEWAWSLEEPALERVRLYVHEDNTRAAAFYRRFGFVPSGRVVSLESDPDAKELEYVLERPAS
ncbi:GNAT family N-acetyltransferase [Streptomyces sp. NPDC051211]|uniref:GNAT family N-acetyltransferase n=1 Tax=Streptomyces sp. NPDC051211 TaxID=3154643 RepID=UPI00344BBCA1